MAHQLDISLTVFIDDAESVLLLDNALQCSKHVTSDKIVQQCLHVLALLLQKQSSIKKFYISHDINWDEEEYEELDSVTYSKY